MLSAPLLHVRDRLRRLQHADFEGVCLLLARLEETQRAALPIVGTPATEAVGWLDAGNVRSQTELLPLPQERQLVGPLLDVQPQSKPPVDERRQRPTLGV